MKEREREREREREYSLILRNPVTTYASLTFKKKHTKGFLRNKLIKYGENQMKLFNDKSFF